MVIERTCRDCGERFTIGENEAQWYAALAKAYPERHLELPWTCASCRFLRRKSRDVVDEVSAEDIEIMCIDCGAPFLFRVQDQTFYRDRGYSKPRRCPPCRRRVRPRAG